MPTQSYYQKRKYFEKFSDSELSQLFKSKVSKIAEIVNVEDKYILLLLYGTDLYKHTSRKQHLNLLVNKNEDEIANRAKKITDLAKEIVSKKSCQVVSEELNISRQALSMQVAQMYETSSAKELSEILYSQKLTKLDTSHAREISEYYLRSSAKDTIIYAKEVFDLNLSKKKVVNLFKYHFGCDRQKYRQSDAFKLLVANYYKDHTMPETKRYFKLAPEEISAIYLEVFNTRKSTSFRRMRTQQKLEKVITQ